MLSPKSKLNRERQHSVFMHISGTNLRSPIFFKNRASCLALSRGYRMNALKQSAHKNDARYL